MKNIPRGKRTLYALKRRILSTQNHRWTGGEDFTTRLFRYTIRFHADKSRQRHRVRAAATNLHDVYASSSERLHAGGARKNRDVDAAETQSSTVRASPDVDIALFIYLLIYFL